MDVKLNGPGPFGRNFGGIMSNNHFGGGFHQTCRGEGRAASLLGSISLESQKGSLRMAHAMRGLNHGTNDIAEHIMK